MKGGLTNKTKPGLTNLASEPGSVISEIQADIEKIEAETAIYEYANFNARTNAIDFIGFHIVDRIDGLIQEFGQKDELIN